MQAEPDLAPPRATPGWQRGLVWIAECPRAAWAVVAAAVAVRVGLVVARGDYAPYTSELQGVARTLAATGRIADAYGPGTGLTSHVGMVSPLLPAFAYWLFGEGVAAELFLTAVAAAVIGLTALACNAVFRRLGTPAAARGLAIALVVLVPLQAQLETVDLRARETALAALGLATVIAICLKLDAGPRPLPWRWLALLSMLCGVLFLLSPAAAVAAYAACGVMAVRCLPLRRWPATAAMAAATVVLMSAPWALRNQHVFGETVLTRGNFGLEYALGTNAAAVDPVDPAATFRATLKAIHPYKSAAVRARMAAAGGEVAYSRQLGTATAAWVAAHPAEARRIWLRHAREFYLPPAWLWNPYATPTPVQRWLAAGLIAATLAAFANLALRLWQRRWDYLYVALPLFTVMLPYALLQPRLRYRYVITTLLVFLLFDLARRSFRPPTGPAAVGAR